MCSRFFTLLSFVLLAVSGRAQDELPRLAYHHPGLVVDLGVGLWAWPLPVDHNGDGRMDLIVVCTDRPSRGTWYFENSGVVDPETRLPLFRPAVKLAEAVPSPTISYATGRPIVTTGAAVKEGETYRYRGLVYPDFAQTNFAREVPIVAPEKIHLEPGGIRQNQWQFVDFDGDGALDLTIGIDFWGEYGAVSSLESVWDREGNWIKGPLRGYIYLLRNRGTTEKPDYAPPQKVMAGGQPVAPFGMPSPMWGDFRGTGKLDLLCGEFRDGFTFYENTGTRSAPVYAPGRELRAADTHQRLHLHLCMITPVAVDFNGDGHLDVVSGDEDGRVAFIENTGRVVDGTPQFLAPRYFRQQAADVKFGALITPYAIDWDGDGREDLLAGNSSGEIAFIRNLGGQPVRWAAPELLRADGTVIREQAGLKGSVQGPAEAKWGYSILSVGDWDGDGLPDVMTNGIWGKIIWYKNVGTRTAPKLAAGQPVMLAPGSPTPKPAWIWWTPAAGELVTQWRTTPQMYDWNNDGLMDLIMLDQEGYLALYERGRDASGQRILHPGRRVFRGEGVSAYDSDGKPTNAESGPLRLNSQSAGRSGRRTFCIMDWDGDGRSDLLVNSKPNVNFLRNRGVDAQGYWVFEDKGPISEHALAGHATKPAPIDLDGDGRRELLIGAEDGFLYVARPPVRK